MTLTKFKKATSSVLVLALFITIALGQMTIKAYAADVLTLTIETDKTTYSTSDTQVVVDIYLSTGIDAVNSEGMNAYSYRLDYDSTIFNAPTFSKTKAEYKGANDEGTLAWNLVKPGVCAVVGVDMTNASPLVDASAKLVTDDGKINLGTFTLTFKNPPPAGGSYDFKIETPKTSTNFAFIAGINVFYGAASNSLALTNATVGVCAPITGFSTISNVAAGNAGATTYTNAAAVISALPTTATASYSGGTVSGVPITTWVDTDGFNPNAAGSYTFTGTVGTMPTGYINSGGFSPKVEVVVGSAEISGFVSITDVSAGKAGASTYANAAAVIAVLPTTVTANTAAGTVGVLVSAWVDTDTYKPATVGSYTFTATLGTIPSGYANTGSYTATVKVVVSAATEITGFAAITDVSAGKVGAATYANATAVKAALPTTVTASYSGGTISVPVSAWVDTDTYSATTAGSYTFAATLGTIPGGYANTGSYTATVEVVVSTATEITGFSSLANVAAGPIVAPTYAESTAVIVALPTTVTATYSGGTVSVPVSTWVDTDKYSTATAGSYTFTATLGTLPGGYANIGSYTATVEVIVTATCNITSFASISNVSAGNAGSATYSDAAAVIAVLPKTVTANTAYGTVSVPVSTWVDADTYSAATAGSYTFTATIGTLPSGYTNSGSSTATVEVVVSAAASSGSYSYDNGTYTITYNGNGSTGGSVPSAASYTAGSKATIIGNTGLLVKTGYTFDGWNTAADGSGTDYVEGNAITLSSAVTFYAQWKKSSTVSYVSTDWQAASPNDYVVVYKIVDGKEVIVPGCYYDASTGTVKYNGDSAGTYYAKYNYVTFSDVTQDSWASEYISYLAARGILNGNSDGTFGLNNTLTRAQFVKILACMTSGLNVSGYSSAGFSDVDSSAWYATYVNWASASGIITGYTNGTFGANDPITREQMCAIIQQYVEHIGHGLSTGSVSTMADSGSISSWATESVGAAIASGLINGKGNNIFDPQGNTTRAEAAAVICRLLKSVMNISDYSVSVDYQA